MCTNFIYIDGPIKSQSTFINTSDIKNNLKLLKSKPNLLLNKLSSNLIINRGRKK